MTLTEQGAKDSSLQILSFVYEFQVYTRHQNTCEVQQFTTVESAAFREGLVKQIVWEFYWDQALLHLKNFR